MKKEGEKTGLKLNIKQLKSWYLAPLLHGNREGKSGNSDRFLIS